MHKFYTPIKQWLEMDCLQMQKHAVTNVDSVSTATFWHFI